ncbi:MAG TPA: ComEC/Rec2 family competence protein [Candidatus Absconditabacterales bacterium]|nr:ComEC/Rec2 family competence protein [Candidatus Absconditabacterales bacterium]
MFFWYWLFFVIGLGWFSCTHHWVGLGLWALLYLVGGGFVLSYETLNRRYMLFVGTIICLGCMSGGVVMLYDHLFVSGMTHYGGDTSWSGTGIVVGTTKPGTILFQDSHHNQRLGISPKQVEVGQIVMINGRITTVAHRPHRLWSNWTTFDYSQWLWIKGYQGVIHINTLYKVGTHKNWSTRTKQSLYNLTKQAYGDTDYRGLLVGMLIGGRAFLSQERYDEFVQSGLVHLIAVSGGNMVLIGSVIGLFLFWMPYYLRLLCIVLGLIGFTIICGMDSSVVRALVMGTIGILGLFAGRIVNMLRIIGVTMMLMLLVNPYRLVFDLGFGLSFGAVTGIIITSKARTHMIDRYDIDYKWIRWLLYSFIGGMIIPAVGATLGVVPLLLMSTGVYNLTGFIASLATQPLVPWITLGGGVTLMLESMNVSIPWIVYIIKRSIDLMFWIGHRSVQYALIIQTSDRGWIIMVVFSLSVLGGCWMITKKTSIGKFSLEITPPDHYNIGLFILLFFSSMSFPYYSVGLGLMVGCLMMGGGAWATGSLVPSTTTMVQVIVTTGADGTVHRKTVTSKTVVNSVDEIKNTLVTTSVNNEHLLYDTIQTYRKSNKNKVTLKYSTKLASISRGYAKYLADHNYFNHTSKEGANGKSRLVSGGVTENTYWGELLAKAIDVQQAFDTLKGSKLHNEIMLKDDYTVMGVGYYQGSWVVMFLYDKTLKYADKQQPTLKATPKKLKKKKLTPIV